MTQPTDLATVAKLAKLVGSEKRARALLKQFGVDHVNDVFPLADFLDPFARRLRAGSRTARSATRRPLRTVDAAAVAREHLGWYGIEPIDVIRGRRTVLLLKATKEERQVKSYDPPGPVRTLRIPPRDHDLPPVAAALYSTVDRQQGSARFLAAGYSDPSAPELYLFALLSEPRRVWLLTKNDLMELEREAGLAKRRNVVGDVGFVRHTGREGVLRLWMPASYRTGADLSERIAGPDGLLIGSEPVG